MWNTEFSRVYFSFFILSIAITFSHTACSFIKSPPQGSGSGFVREEFLEYGAVVILPFQGDETGEVSDAFALTFHKRFPDMDIFGGKKILKILGEYDPGSFQLDEKTRMKIGEKVGAQAIVVGSVYYPSITRWLLQIKIIDTKTGGVLGHASAEINYMGAMGFEEGCDLAVRNLQPR